jgi:predicted alpha/beta-fold hydrolase
MPLLESTYRPPFGFGNGHVQSIYPAVWRKVPRVVWMRERIDTPDGDFLDLDCAGEGRDRVALLSHGLEGHANQPYIRGMARALMKRGWDVVAWNCRGCSGEPNRQLRFYHSGSSEDLGTVMDHILASGKWREVALVGFSLGGNQTLKLLGERGESVDERVVGAVAISVTCDLAASSVRLGEWQNQLYMARFMKTLRQKVIAKERMFPGQLDLEGLEDMRTFKQFDDRYTAPLHGFADAEDYWAKCGSIRFIKNIRVPTLLINALDDPFLGGRCFPGDEAGTHSNFFLETPAQGGHVGFVTFGQKGEYWSESRAAAFLKNYAGAPK